MLLIMLIFTFYEKYLQVNVKYLCDTISVLRDPFISWKNNLNGDNMQHYVK